MKKAYLIIPMLLLFVAMVSKVDSFANNDWATSGLDESKTIKSEDSNEKKSEDDVEESHKAFDRMMEVLTHKRCVNCHPAGDAPLQGEDSHVHHFGVKGGEDGHGVPALSCNSCHQVENNDLAGIPGAPDWHLAPISMAWEGLSRVEIAQSMTDPERNGGKNIHQIEEHLTEHALVLWAFDPGVDSEGTPREVPPVSKEDYIAAVKKWVETGAHIPAE